MHYWLVKSEPYEYSYQDLERDGRCRWTGVRNYAARNHLREMVPGDQVLYYHSRQGLEVVGIATVASFPYPDPTADGKDWTSVDLEPLRSLPRAIGLKAIKAEPALADIPLVRQSRLSVMPLPEAAFHHIRKMGGDTD